MVMSRRAYPARDPLSCRLTPARLPRTGFHHSLPAAWFALRCLAYVLANPIRNRLKEH